MTELSVVGRTESVVIPSALVKVKTKRVSYEEKLAIFAGGRLFHEVEAGVTHDANGLRCQACGSAAPKRLRNIEDMAGNRYLVGNDCYFALKTIPDDIYWEAFKAIGRPIELWIEENKAQLGYKPYFMWLEKYLENPDRG
jgi:hypothetical protein